ncbi:MAG: hypothetical protein GF316_00285 [Candidatus Lokiarchaeota archaeon]|nr:hypothetical protein [Candidatus Lokiarchaeota archaeon]
MECEYYYYQEDRKNDVQAPKIWSLSTWIFVFWLNVRKLAFTYSPYIFLDVRHFSDVLHKDKDHYFSKFEI